MHNFRPFLTEAKMTIFVLSSQAVRKIKTHQDRYFPKQLTTGYLRKIGRNTKFRECYYEVRGSGS